MIELKFSLADARKLEQFRQAAPKEAADAQRRAINKTLRWLRTHMSRAISRRDRIAVTAVRQRLSAYAIRPGGKQGKLWLGLDPLEASRLGKVRQTATGVSVAGRRFRGAFYQKVYGGKPDVWIRTHSKHFSTSAYPGVAMGGPAIDEGMAGRFPVAKVKVSIEDVREEFEQWVDRAAERLAVVLQQEMRYAMMKAIQR